MIGIDTNGLVALAITGHPDHAQAVTAFESELANGQEVVLSAAVAAELLHVITDPRRFVPAHTMSDAIAWLQAWEMRVAPRWIAPTDAAIRLWLTWMQQFQLGRKRLLDTQYAAMLYSSGVRRVLTNNGDDFQVFKVFEIVSF